MTTLTSVRAWACRDSSTRRNEEIEFRSSLSAVLDSEVCSLLEITHLGIRFERLAPGDKLYAESIGASGWVSFAAILNHAQEGFPMCRRGAKRGGDTGPNPWQEADLRVRLGPVDSQPQPLHASSHPAPSSHTPVVNTQAASQTHAPLTPAYWSQTPLPMNGLAMYYNPGIMSQVVEYRARMGEIEGCDQCVGFAALLRGGDLNRKIWIQWSDGAIEGPFLVADVAARHHVDMLIRRGWAVDVDNQTAVRRGLSMPVAVTIYADPPGGNSPSTSSPDD